jgi:hypothetical protein
LKAQVNFKTPFFNVEEKHNSQRRPEDAVPTLKGGASRYRNLKLIMKGVVRHVASTLTGGVSRGVPSEFDSKALPDSKVQHLSGATIFSAMAGALVPAVAMAAPGGSTDDVTMGPRLWPSARFRLPNKFMYFF